MIHLNLAEAKSHLSEYLDRVQAGETLVICRRNVPIAELRPIAAPTKHPRIFGQDVGHLTIHASFFEPLPDDELDLWAGAASGDK